MKSLVAAILMALRHMGLYRKYRDFTMAPAKYFWRNMLIVSEHRHVAGCVIECGVWRGGMSAGMAEILGPNREYILFDSFEGLPPATEKDGSAAHEWQADKEGPTYFNNCSAPIEYAEAAMRMSSARNVQVIKGWFEDTVTTFVPSSPIAVLRLDGDWYESTITVLRSLFQHMAKNGIVIVDDYYAWDGCSRAIHDFLSDTQSNARITQKYGVCVVELRN